MTNNQPPELLSDKDLDQRLSDVLNKLIDDQFNPLNRYQTVVKAKQAIQALYAKQQSKLNQIQDALNMQEKLMRDYHGRPDCKNCSLAEVVQGILTQDTTNTKGGEDE